MRGPFRESCPVYIFRSTASFERYSCVVLVINSIRVCPVAYHNKETHGPDKEITDQIILQLHGSWRKNDSQARFSKRLQISLCSRCQGYFEESSVLSQVCVELYSLVLVDFSYSNGWYWHVLLDLLGRFFEIIASIPNEDEITPHFFIQANYTVPLDIINLNYRNS